MVDVVVKSKIGICFSLFINSSLAVDVDVVGVVVVDVDGIVVAVVVIVVYVVVVSVAVVSVVVIGVVIRVDDAVVDIIDGSEIKQK